MANKLDAAIGHKMETFGRMLRETDFQKCLEVLSSLAPALDRDDLARGAASTSGTPRSLLQELLRFTSFVAQQAEQEDREALDIARDAINGLLPFLGEVDETRIEELVTFIEAALREGNTVWVSLKAAALIQAADRVYHEARIITDVRPLFSDQSISPPVSGLVYHNLRITHGVHGRSGDETLTFALDSDDLEKLRVAIVRAQEKEQELASLCRDSFGGLVK